MDQPFLLQEQIEDIIAKLENGKQVRKKIADAGKVRIERKLPYLIVYRLRGEVDKHSVRLVLGEISYLIASDDEKNQSNVSKVVFEIAKKLSNEFGAFMILEVWIGDENSQAFKIRTAKDKAPATIEKLRSELSELQSLFPQTDVLVEQTNERHPDGLPPLITLQQCKEAGSFLMGLEIPPIYKSSNTKEFYPIFFRTLKSQFSKVIRKTVYEFLRVQTSAKIESYHMLGSRSLGQAVWHVDRKLAEIEEKYHFLLLISPTNTQEARQKFKESKFSKIPKFSYRILPVDPDYLKEELFKINIRNIEDPTLAYLFRDKREEVEKQITMLRERGTKDFMYTSIRLYKGVDKTLLNIANAILEQVPPVIDEGGPVADCNILASKAKEEIKWYRQTYPKLNARVEIKPDVIGLMVSKGQLLIGETYHTSQKRVEPLIQHEVGTHVLTFYNGKAQPLKLLSNGFADYDELQEGLAVLSEYLVGGLTAGRLRLLAARVVAAHSLTQGAEFIETFSELKVKHGFDFETAFDVTTRIHQGGGCTKDIIYLRGLVNLLEYLKNGGELEPLFVGKIAAKHVPIMEELRLRKVLRKVPMLPRYLKNKKCPLKT